MTLDHLFLRKIRKCEIGYHRYSNAFFSKTAANRIKMFIFFIVVNFILKNFVYIHNCCNANHFLQKSRNVKLVANSHNSTHVGASNAFFSVTSGISAKINTTIFVEKYFLNIFIYISQFEKKNRFREKIKSSHILTRYLESAVIRASKHFF